MSLGLDTNILAYNAAVERDPEDRPKIHRTQTLLRSLAHDHQLIAPVQALGELYVVLLRAGQSREGATLIVSRLREKVDEAASRPSTLTVALELATDHRLQFWDSLILSACSEAGCAVVLSEDMGHGFAWRGLTVINPFADDADARLGRLTR